MGSSSGANVNINAAFPNGTTPTSNDFSALVRFNLTVLPGLVDGWI